MAGVWKPDSLGNSASRRTAPLPLPMEPPPPGLALSERWMRCWVIRPLTVTQNRQNTRMARAQMARANTTRSSRP